MNTQEHEYTKVKRRKKIDKYLNLIQSDEPVISPETPISRTGMIPLVSWYHTRYTGEEGRQWLVDYTKLYLPQYLLKAQEGKLYYVQPCTYARLILRGAKVPEEVVIWLHKFIRNMELPAPKAVDNRVQNAQLAKRARVEEREDEFDEFMASFEKDYDRIIMGGKSDFEVHKALQSFKPTGVKVRDFIRSLKERLREIKEAVKKGNDFTEAYDSYPRMRLRAMESFYVLTIEACERYIAGGTTKKQRKPRSKKYVPVERAVAKVQLGSGTVFGIKPLPPESVLDASAVVLYNTKYNQLTLLRAESKFTIKGTTIQGISEKDSIRKRIKKPQETLTKVSKAININAIVNIFDTIKNQPSAATGRLNEDTYLIKVFK